LLGIVIPDVVALLACHFALLPFVLAKQLLVMIWHMVLIYFSILSSAVCGLNPPTFFHFSCLKEKVDLFFGAYPFLLSA